MRLKEAKSPQVKDLGTAWERRMEKVRTVQRRLDYSGMRRRSRSPAKRRALEERNQLNPLER